HGVAAVAREDWIRLGTPRPPTVVPDYEYRLDVPGEVHVVETGATVRASFLEGSAHRPQAAGWDASIILPSSAAVLPLTVRRRRPSNVAGADGRPQGAAERAGGGADCGRCAGTNRVGCRPGRSRGGARRDTPGGHGSLGVQEGHTVSSTLKSILFWMTLVVVLALIWQFSQSFQMSGSRISFSDFLTRVNQKEIQSVTFVGSNEVRGKYVALSSDGVPKSFVTYMPPSYEGLVNTLMGFGVEVSSERESDRKSTRLNSVT